MNAKKIMAALLAVVLLIGIGVGGTLAWLKAATGPVTNTFTVGDIAIDLKEHKLNEAGTALLEGTTNETDSVSTYKIVPGDTQPKDPFVRFTKDSEPCWLFVKVEEKNNTVGSRQYVTYSVDSGWTPLTDADSDGKADDGVYFKKLESLTTANTEFYILTANQVSYSEDLTKADLNAVETNKPQLVFTAYAVQLEAAANEVAAWAKVG